MSNLEEEGQGGASEEGGMAGGTEDEGGMGGQSDQPVDVRRLGGQRAQHARGRGRPERRRRVAR